MDAVKISLGPVTVPAKFSVLEKKLLYEWVTLPLKTYMALSCPATMLLTMSSEVTIFTKMACPSAASLATNVLLISLPVEVASAVT